MASLAQLVAAEVATLLRPIVRAELAASLSPAIQPVLLDVKQAAVYLGRTEQAIQHLIFQRELPVIRYGRRVHLHRTDLDAWIEKNRF